MASFLLSYVSCPKPISLTKDSGIDFSHRLCSFKINRVSFPAIKLSRRSTTMSVAPLDVRNIILDGYGYRQRFNVRSYEAETKNITIQSIFNFLEEASWNYVRLFWVYANESGATRRMIKNDLRWVVSRMELQIDEYPNPTWAMVNQKTRRVWKMPDEVRAEISHSFIEKQAIIQDHPKKLCKIDDNARYVISGLQPKRKDMDMNNCVSNKTYVDWMLEVTVEK
ncbi:putative oleoyl-[acyl-carrier-protein] hydrolase [Helianthus annuus]|nr:putative oleoyl-[acyl-carrier-protein] hydrolase [Helianthus annuus]KAJ0636483.1 putative oleoyl-[acyl-carrier-protein] hydrolase [Helianthus annuus]